MNYTPKSRLDAREFEKFIITEAEHANAPDEARKAYADEISFYVPTAIAKHPIHGYAVIQTSGQGPYFIWPETFIS